ncbi:tyrosine-type recombinase/integrase [Streptomyces sp. WAC08401]|uniref:tyrosine-type recombinase/integrase n=1 Tax=Streptomyces sp. WAC08401 TaxID=2487413 RepID=UPI000FAFA91B|nr:tyrosine-type recombinase/integrase [Streptomyces sp. WAC08401]RSS11350.1 site-specific integrase [Streptomyces sp. WAC08401]
MPGYIEDRWYTKKPDAATGKKRRTARYGKGKRWRVAGIPGVRDRSFEREADAKAWLKESATDSTRGTFYDPRDGEMTLREYVEEYWWPNLRKPPGTKESMKPRVFNHILPHVGHLSLNRIGHDEILAWQTKAERNIDVSTLATTWRHFSSIMQAAHKAKRIPVNPFRDEDLKAPAVPKSKAKAWSPETVIAMRAALPARYGILLDLGIAAGLRQGEAFGFSPDDVDGDEIKVVRQVVRINSRLGFAPPKGNKERIAPCPPALARAVKEHANLFPTVEVTLPWVDPDRPNLDWGDRPLKTVRLLVTTIRTSGKSGGAMNRTYFDDHVWKPALVKAGVIPAPEVEVVRRPGRATLKRVRWRMPREEGFHVTRHTFASIVLQAGETITQLAAWLGHSDPAFTLRTYVHFMPKSGSKGLAALGAWVAPGAAGEGEVSAGSDSPQILPSARSSEGAEGVPAGQ